MESREEMTSRFEIGEKQTKHDVAGANEDDIEVIRARDLKDPV
jgi:hypothetical protein